jgi:hypothetical protein
MASLMNFETVALTAADEVELLVKSGAGDGVVVV